MKNFKDVLAGKDCIWFEIEPSDGKKFLKWAKDLGCIWLNGKEIEPEKGADFFHFSIYKNGRLAYVPICAWVSKTPNIISIERRKFKLN